MTKKEVVISPMVYPGLKLTQSERDKLNEKNRPLRYKISKETIMEIVAQECGVTIEDIINRSRKREKVDARHIFCAILKEHFGYKLEKIGQIVDGRDHTTIIHAVTTYKDRFKNEDAYKEKVLRIFNLIGIEK